MFALEPTFRKAPFVIPNTTSISPWNVTTGPFKNRTNTALQTPPQSFKSQPLSLGPGHPGLLKLPDDPQVQSRLRTAGLAPHSVAAEPGHWQKCRLSGPPPDLLDQSLISAGAPGDSYAVSFVIDCGCGFRLFQPSLASPHLVA